MNKADPVVWLYQNFPLTGNLTYNGASQSPTWDTADAYTSVPGALSVTTPAHINSGTYMDAFYTFTPTDTTDYNTITGSLSWTLNQASPTINVKPYDVTYNGQQHTATGTVTGVNGGSLTGLSLTGTVHTNAGLYADSWTFTDPTGNYYSASSTDYGQPAVFDIINRASVIANILPVNTTYDGYAHSATIDIMGVSEQLTTITTASHTNAGTYSDVWAFSDPANNYVPESSTVTDIIAKANVGISVVGYNTFYNAVAHAATGTATLPGLNLGGTVHTNVGTYTDTWTFTAPNSNYNNASGIVIDTITRSKSKMVRETVNVPKTVNVKVTERVWNGKRWVKKIETVLETKMVKKAEMVKVYYS